MTSRNEPLPWRDLVTELRGRLQFVFRPAVLLYFVAVVVGLGGCSIWIAMLWKGFKLDDWSLDRPLVVQNAGTYTLGLVAAAASDLIGTGTNPASRSLRMLVLSSSLFAGAFAMVGYLHPRAGVALPLVCISSVAAWAIWLIANGRDQRFSDEPIIDPSVTTGGSPEAEPAGSLDGLKT